MSATAQWVSFGPYFDGGQLVTAPRIYHYLPGTTTLKDAWQERTKLNTLPNPIVGDAEGLASAYVDGLYKIVVADANDVVLYTFDNWGLSAPTESWVDVTHPAFGAVGDNGVTDNAAAIQAAINSMTSGILYFPGTAGSYGIGAAGLSFVNKSNIRILAEGATIKLLATSGTSLSTFGSTALRFDACSKLRIVGLTIDGNGKASNHLGFRNCTECVIEGNSISSGGLNAGIISFGGNRNVIARNTVRLTASGCRGIWAGNVNTGEEETGSEVAENNVQSCGATGIVLTGSDLRAHDNYSDGNAGSGLIVSSAAASGVTSRRIVVADNILRGNDFHGFQSDASVHNSDYIGEVTVIGNTCYLNDGSGIYAANVRDGLLVGNTCYDNNADASGTGNGIYLEAALRVVIGNNRCYDSRAGGSRTQSNGILLQAQTAALEITDILIQGNHCENNADRGISVTSSGAGTLARISVTGNQTYANANYGIRVVPTTMVDSAVTNNLSSGHPTDQDLYVQTVHILVHGNLGTNGGTLGWLAGTSQLPTNDTTPSIKGRSKWVAANTNPTTITMFDDGVDGQTIELLFTNGNTTITDGGNLKLSGAANFVGSADDVLVLQYASGVWYEMSRSVN